MRTGATRRRLRRARFSGPYENPALRTLIVHGDADITVSHLQSVELYEALKANGEDVTLKLVPKCKHADDRLFTDELLSEVEAFLWESFE